MSKYTYNDGKFKTIRVPEKFKGQKLKLSALIELDDENSKVAGHSIINLAGDAAIEDVQFRDHFIGTDASLADKSLSVIVNATKFLVRKKKVSDSKAVATVKLKLEADDGLVEEFLLNDGENTESNSIFKYLLKF